MTMLHFRCLRSTASACALLAFIALPVGAATEYEKRADGLVVYMGVLPAQVLRGETDHRATMHGGLPSGSGSHHLVIAIFEERTGNQVVATAVNASVGPLGMGMTRRKLEPMLIGPTTTYGNFFPMPGPGPYRIRVSIQRAGETRATEVQFNYSHPQ